jgi:NH3-dependent NAD+ synthetase
MQTDKKEDLNVQKLYLSSYEYYQETIDSYAAFIDYYNSSLSLNINIDDILKDIRLIEENKRRMLESISIFNIAFKDIIYNHQENSKANEILLAEVKSKSRLLNQYTHSIKKNKSKCKILTNL